MKKTPLLSINSGYIALVSVLIMSALMLLIGIGTTMRGIDTTTMSGGEELSLRAELLADSCAEEALLRLRANLAYAGNEIIIVSGGSTCTILPLSGTGNTDRTITTRATESNYTRFVRVEVAQVNPSLVITSWTTVR
jgi:hypothetical protein